MNPELAHVQSAKSWRDISQPVRPRAMSRGGRMRLALAVARVVGFVAFSAGLGWGVWMVAGAVRNPQGMSAAVKAPPMRTPELLTTRDGVLDHAWLIGALGVRPGVSLMEIDLAQLRTRLLADPQVLTATLTRHFPDRLTVQITERMPIARVRIETDGGRRDLLAARDGVVFAGTGHDPAMLATLPWLDAVSLVREGRGFRAAADMESVARLLSTAQYSAPHLYAGWRTISLARLEEDSELEVTTEDGVTAVFSVKREFFRQLAHLSYLSEELPRSVGERVRIDLSYGREVLVRTVPDAPAASPASGAKTTAVRRFLNIKSQ